MSVREGRIIVWVQRLGLDESERSMRGAEGKKTSKERCGETTGNEPKQDYATTRQLLLLLRVPSSSVPESLPLRGELLMAESLRMELGLVLAARGSSPADESCGELLRVPGIETGRLLLIEVGRG